MNTDRMRCRRLENVDRFLATRNLDRLRVREIVDDRIDDCIQILLTSSPVHGLANSLSDIDLICVVPGDDLGARMAAQIFESGNHLETITFSESEVDIAIENLAAVAETSPAEAVARMHDWNDDFALKKKYLERTINGLSVTGEMPFSRHLPALGAVWKWLSLDSFARSVSFACLAEAAGEHRGRLAYGLEAMLSLMDATLSQHGDVYSNKKWFALRWALWMRDETSRSAIPEALRDAVERLRNALNAGLRGEPAALRGPVLRDVLQSARDHLDHRCGAGFGWRLRDDVETRPFLPDGTAALTADRGLALLRGEPASPRAVSPDEMMELPPETARSWLQLARAGLLEADVWSGRCTAT